ncbi:MAG TPA: molecular chaperone DnaJ [Sphingobium sp.]|nr:molecular chaperone DnaJ [Sphingobium sp.]
MLAALGFWWWLGKRRRKIPAAWLGVGGSLIGTLLAARGLPLIGALLVTGSGLWLRYGANLLGIAGKARPAAPTDPRLLDRAAAADLLGVSPEADAATIHAAYRRLMARNHPDAGGSAGLAARINAARDLLLKSRDTQG